MIIGLDHIAYNTANVGEFIVRLEKLGYIREVYDRGIVNNENKKDYLSHWGPVHDIAILKHPDNNFVPIEVTAHAHLDSSGVMYAVRQGGDDEWHWGTWDTVDMGQGWSRHIKAKVTDLDADLRFWEQGMGMAVEYRDEGEALLLHHTPFPGWNWCLHLEESFAEPMPSKLDAHGCTRIGLISTNITDDLSRVQSMNAKQVRGPFVLNVGGKKLRIVLLRAPGSEPVELIEVLRE